MSTITQNTAFSLPATNGKQINSTDLLDENKALVVIFTCNHCPYAVAYEERLNELQEWLKDKDVSMVAICSNDAEKYPQDSFEEMKKRAEVKGFEFPYLHDENQEIAENYGAERTPHAFVIDAAGAIVYSGAIDDNYQNPEKVSKEYLKKAVKAVLSGNEPSPGTTQAVGCSIKWK